MTKYVYLFKEGNGSMRELLGGKGANLAEMTSLGMPVPQGFTISTEACTRYYDDGRTIGADIIEQIDVALAEVEKINGKKFGDTQNPLLVSVRSGARASMPGMMDTILNLGLNDEVAAGLIAGNPDPKFERFVYDSYRRFIQMFSDVVMELSKKRFEVIIDEVKEEKGITQDIDLDTEDMKKLVKLFKEFYKSEKGVDFPSDPKVQLMEAVKAVFRSWDNPRANVYRRMNDIPYSWGTAVNVQPMVFGNLNENSGTGVAFTRDPATGEKALFGEYLINAQGEDVVAGVRTPSPIARLAEDMPEVYKQFKEIADNLEKHYKDMQDMEFTIENGKLYMLQTRNGKRTAAAALKVAVDLVDEGMITEEEAVLRVDPKQLDSLLHPTFDAAALKAATPVGQGLAASPGAACGQIVFTAEDAKVWDGRGQKVVLVRLETSPEDIEGMVASQGILTVRGGMTSHAAVVARGMGTCCVSGCSEIKMHADEKYFTLNGRHYHEGDWISLDGSTGKIYGEAIPTAEATISGDFGRYMAWADAARTLKVRTNADNPRDAEQAVRFGAEGIGLCRTEHMFFEGDRIKAVREMILAKDVEGRKAALAKILPYQQGDFEAMYKVLEGRPMTVRYLDPPLHEFLPTKQEEMIELANEMNVDLQDIIETCAALHEFNPMMGHRGCRLAVTYPEIAEMQTKAVINAAINVNREHPEYNIVPEIMIPLVGEVKELKFVKDVVVATADKEIAAAGVEMK
ncbi:MAG: pyruvate, phosphate dikinase, partial [Clostridia bacterium]|nr:pyruvate, phosphate dikinase [Clostridia bacterium]